jgi:hypothetical protein
LGKLAALWRKQGVTGWTPEKQSLKQIFLQKTYEKFPHPWEEAVRVKEARKIKGSQQGCGFRQSAHTLIT